MERWFTFLADFCIWDDELNPKLEHDDQAYANSEGFQLRSVEAQN